jgi:hypothetical protein
MAKSSQKIGPDPLLAKPFYLLTADDYDVHDAWRAECVAATMTPERRAEIERDAALAAEARQDSYRNAWPVLKPGTQVKADVMGWRNGDVQVAHDPGPADNGARRITVEKIAREQRITVRRDRVRVVTA